MPALLLKTCAQLREFRQQERAAGRSVGVVPTMGALHAGHLSLVRQSLAENDTTLVTIFVNPTQFAPHEDLEKYPRDLAADQRLLESVGEVVVFAPAVEEMYPPRCTTSVVPPAISKKLEGEFRPQHFAGVATVVLKLLHLTEPHRAYFGQKDFQQVAVVKQMVADLLVPCEIRVCPIARDPDGLALSSRNVYLSPEQREVALTLSRTLAAVAAEIQAGQTDGFEIITEMRQRLIDGGVDSIDYAVVADPLTLETCDPIRLPAVALIAAHVGQTRLIDNCLIEAPATASN